MINDTASAKDQGFILIVVIWLMAFLSLAGLAVSRSVQAHIRQTANFVQLRQAELLADGGVTLATLDLAKLQNRTGTGPDGRSSQSRRFPIDGSTVRCAIDDAVLTISVQDAGGRIGLNTSSERLLQALFLGLGSTVDSARRAADTIIDFRDSDDLRRAHGAELPEYQAAGRLLGPKNEPFDALEELHQVLGLDDQMISAMKPYVNIHSVTAGLDPRAASPALIGLIVRGAAKLPVPLSTEGQSGLPAEFIIGSPQRTFHVTVQAELPSGTVYVRDAVVELTAGNGLPSIKSWKRGNRLTVGTTDRPAPPPNC